MVTANKQGEHRERKISSGGMLKTVQPNYADSQSRGLRTGNWELLHELPISTPVMNTSAPPSPICSAAETHGLSI